MKEIIKNYLDKYALENEHFNISYQNNNRNIDGCVSYITNQAKKELNGKNGAIEETKVFHWAREYYELDEEQLSKLMNTSNINKTSKKDVEDDDENVKPIKDTNNKKVKKHSKGVHGNQLLLFEDF